MKRLLGSFLFIVIAYGQDTLYTTTGMAYLGSFIEQSETHVTFHPDDSDKPQSLPLNVVDRVGMFMQITSSDPTPAAGEAGLEKTDPAMETDNSYTGSPFRQGSISAGSLFSYSSYKWNKDDDDPTTTMTAGSGFPVFMMIVKPAISYFFMDNWSIDGIISLTKYDSGDWEDSFNVYGAGISHYLGNIYGGAGYAVASSGDDDYRSTSNYLELHAGFLSGLSDNVFLDVGASYLMGTGEHSSEYEGETHTRDNEETTLSLNVGVKAIFSLMK